MSKRTVTRSESIEATLNQLLRELRHVDLLIERAVERLRESRGREPNELPGLYVSDAEVDAILAGAYPIGPGLAGPEASPPAQEGGETRLGRLAARFGLTAFDVDALLISLAPELDLAYERIYAYLQDDVTRRRPSVDLVLNLLHISIAAKLTTRSRFGHSAPLLRHRLLILLDEPSQPQPPLLAKLIKVDERVAAYLLGDDEIDARLLPFAVVAPLDAPAGEAPPADLVRRLARLGRADALRRAGLVIALQGPYGVGKRALAAAVCRRLRLGLLVVDGAGLAEAAGPELASLAGLAAREAALRGAALCWEGCEGLLAEDRAAGREALLDAVRDLGLLCFLAGEADWEPAGEWRDQPFAHVTLALPGATERARIWAAALPADAPHDADMTLLAGTFRLSGGQIRDAAAGARRLARLRDPGRPRVTADDLYVASRTQSGQGLNALARKITPGATWDDLVLPPDQVCQLREICAQVTHRALVYDDWGFERRLTRGRGLNVLFAGPPGTGKTMAAEVIAGELGLDLYAIDLSIVVSKYIGETEKNLARIFAAAERSNAILLFDEADALFGKRSEVRDSHDRYANIEVGYLLQKMETYDGVAILATNMRRSLDEAFLRRMQVTVEFPFPAEPERRRIWERAWPAELPLAPDLDLDFAARQLDLTGGNIRNIALAAAFLAAADGQVVTMAHLVRAARREYQKLGKVVLEREFGPYAGLLEA